MDILLLLFSFLLWASAPANIAAIKMGSIIVGNSGIEGEGVRLGEGEVSGMVMVCVLLQPLVSPVKT